MKKSIIFVFVFIIFLIYGCSRTTQTPKHKISSEKINKIDDNEITVDSSLNDTNIISEEESDVEKTTMIAEHSQSSNNAIDDQDLEVNQVNETSFLSEEELN